MSELQSWYEFCAEKKRVPDGAELTAIACPCCGNVLYKDTTVTLTTFPERHRYFCSKCLWSDFA